MAKAKLAELVRRSGKPLWVLVPEVLERNSTIGDAARELGISRQWLYNWLDANNLDLVGSYRVVRRDGEPLDAGVPPTRAEVERALK